MMNSPDNTSPANPYDELPYCAYPIAWTSPERLSLASLLHGGPRLPLEQYRVLELGCANGANLLPLAWYRQQGEFIGLDGSARQIAIANESKDKLGLSNLQFVQGEFSSAVDQLEGPFDVIMAHGVFSWVDDETRDTMLQMSSSLLGTDGLLYLNYNALPGWNVRGMVRYFLMKHTAHISDLKERSELCREISARVVSPLKAEEHAYSRLMGNEFQLVVNQHPAYIAHEYLSPENNAYWRDEFFSILQKSGFDYIADADFNSISNRITTEYGSLVEKAGISGPAAADSADLICYRQMQSPILTHSPLVKKDCDDGEFANLFMASDLIPVTVEKGQNPVFKRPTGEEIETTKESIGHALIELHGHSPRGLRIKSLFADVADVRQDIEWLFQHQLVQLRCIEPGDFEVAPEPLNALERSLRNIATSPWHTTKASKAGE